MTGAPVIDVAAIEARSVVLFDEAETAKPADVQDQAIELMRQAARAGAHVREPADRSRLEAVARFWAAHLRTALGLLVIPPELFSFVGAPDRDLKSVGPQEFEKELFRQNGIASRLKVDGLELTNRLERKSIVDCEIFQGALAGLEFRRESDISRTSFVDCDMSGVRVVVPPNYQEDAPSILRADRSRFENVDLSGAHFVRATFFAAAFRGIKTSTAPVTFSACNFGDAVFKDLTDCEIVFEDGCSLQRAVFEDSDLSRSTMDDCKLDKAGFSEVKLAGLQMRSCSVSGVDFEGALEIEKMQTAEVDMTAAKLGDEQRAALGIEDLNVGFANLREMKLG